MGFNGKILKKIREQKGVTQMQLCHAINLHQSLYSKYERGIVQNVPADKVKKISDYLGVPYESFFVELKENEPVLINQTSGIPERIDVHVHVKIDWGLG
jgi:transcriptional regulator with XRE-family HTH domain